MIKNNYLFLQAVRMRGVEGYAMFSQFAVLPE